MKKFVKYLFVMPTSLLAIIPAVGCSCGTQADPVHDIIPEDKLVITDGVLTGFVDGFDPTIYTELSIPSTVTTIKASAFESKFTSSDCKLTKLTFANTVTTIEAKAFYGNTKIQKINLSSFTTTEGYTWASDAFGGFSSNGTIVYPTTDDEDLENQIDYLLCDAGLDIGWFDSTKERTIEETHLNIDDNNVLQGFDETICSLPHFALYNKLVIPSSVIRVNDNAFYSDEKSTISNIKTLVFNIDAETGYSSVVAIGNNAFKSAGITSLTLQLGLTTLGTSSFENCTSLQTITLPETLATIGESCFAGCSSFAELTIPSNVTFVGSNAFKNCTSLNYISLLGINEVLSSWTKGAFIGISATGSVICEPTIASDWQSYFAESGLFFTTGAWTISDKVDILNGYTSVVNPYPTESTWTLAQFNQYYYSAISQSTNSQILVDDLYHSFYEWTKTVNLENINLTSFKLLIKNATVYPDYKNMSFAIHYEIAGQWVDTEQSFTASGSWTFFNIPFNISSATTVGDESTRKYIKLVDNTFAANRRWYIAVNETYKVIGTGSEDPVTINTEVDYTTLQGKTTLDLNEVGMLMSINKFLEYDLTSSAWTWGILSSYLQNIKIG